MLPVVADEKVGALTAVSMVALPDELLQHIFKQACNDACNVLDPRAAVALSRASHGIRAAAQALLPQLKAYHQAAAALCLKTCTPGRQTTSNHTRPPPLLLPEASTQQFRECLKWACPNSVPQQLSCTTRARLPNWRIRRITWVDPKHTPTSTHTHLWRRVHKAAHVGARCPVRGLRNGPRDPREAPLSSH